MYDTYLDEEETEAIKAFLEKGYHCFQIPRQELLATLRTRLYHWAMDVLKLGDGPGEKLFFDETARFVSLENLNGFRLALIHQLTSSPEIKAWFYHLAREPLHLLVGNELAMQRALNLSIQLPDDTGSLLPLHSDVWSGNSPYEVVFWSPLTDCYRTRSMYLLPRNLSDEITADFHRYAHLSSEDFFHEIEDRVVYVDVPYGHGLIFTHSIIHGNRINRESGARWTMNVRFKSLLSPYGAKEIGESFLPITIRPATRIGYAYREPDTKDQS